MIDSKELMIGNLVIGKDLDELNKSVGENKIQIIASIMMLNSKRYSPIYLTPELLSKIEGFNLNENKEWIIDISPDDILEYSFAFEQFILNGMFIPVKKKYLHEAQNLIKSLSGKDLIIKL